MARHSVYMNDTAENLLLIVFEYLKRVGQIPALATEIGDYRAQCIRFAISYTIGGLAADEPDLYREITAKEASHE